MHNLRRVARLLPMAPRAVVAHMLIAFSKRQVVGGIEVVVATGDDETPAVNNIRSALQLIQTYLPGVHARIRREVQRILLLKAGGPEYWPFAQGVALNARIVSGADIPLLAMLLCHEATHARLWRLGIGYPKDKRDRIERICVKAEVRLARQLPDAVELEEHAMGKLKKEWWREAALVQRASDARRELRDWK